VFSSEVTGGSYSSVTLSGTLSQTYTRGPTCGTPNGKKAAKPVKKGTFTGSADTFGE
jgi:hypothetical protein